MTWLAVDQLDDPTFASRDGIVDNTPPALRVTKASRNKAKLSKNVTITAARVQLLVGGKVAYDRAGNTRSTGKLAYRRWKVSERRPAWLCC